MRQPRKSGPTPQEIALSEIEDQFVTLSRTDKRKGLDETDLPKAVRQVRWLEDNIIDTGGAKASAMADWLVMNANGRISPWVAKTLGYIAFRYARKSGIIP
jgi:hypothetical protein